MFDNEWVQFFQNFCCPHPGLHPHAQCLSGVFIQNSEHFVCSAIAQLVVNKIDAPDVIWILWSQPDDGTIFVIKPFALPVALRELQSLFTPYPFYPFVIDLPTFDPQQFCNLAIAVPAILLGQPD